MLVRDMDERMPLEDIKKHKYWDGFDFENIKSYDEYYKEISEEDLFLIHIKNTF